jgi:hypothetical protein
MMNFKFQNVFFKIVHLDDVLTVRNKKPQHIMPRLCFRKSVKRSERFHQVAPHKKSGHQILFNIASIELFNKLPELFIGGYYALIP